uniref:Uncharacterized protein n=1 Tax=Vitis vinifera TaxID=29760 RepID=F6I1F5_VITVI
MCYFRPTHPLIFSFHYFLLFIWAYWIGLEILFLLTMVFPIARSGAKEIANNYPSMSDCYLRVMYATLVKIFIATYNRLS